jgi:hypothetical protein
VATCVSPYDYTRMCSRRLLRILPLTPDIVIYVSEALIPVNIIDTIATRRIEYTNSISDIDTFFLYSYESGYRYL